MAKLYGLSPLDRMATGFYPFPASWGNVFKNHAAFMIITTQKQKSSEGPPFRSKDV